MEDMKNHATIIIVKPHENTTHEGTKREWKVLLHLSSTLQKTGFKILLLPIRDEFGKNPETAEVSRGTP